MPFTMAALDSMDSPMSKVHTGRRVAGSVLALYDADEIPSLQALLDALGA